MGKHSNHGDNGQAADHVGRCKRQVLGHGGKQGVKYTKCNTHQQVVHRVNAQFGKNLGEEENKEGKSYEQNGILYRTHGFLVGVHRGYQSHAERGFLSGILVADPLLGKIPVYLKDAPFSCESFFLNFSFIREKCPGKTGIIPCRGYPDIRFHSQGNKIQRTASVQVKVKGEIS